MFKSWRKAMRDHREKVRNIPEPALLLHVGNQEVILTGRDMFRYEIENFSRNTNRLLRVKNQLTGRTVDVSGSRVGLVEKVKFIKATREVI